MGVKFIIKIILTALMNFTAFADIINSVKTPVVLFEGRPMPEPCSDSATYSSPYPTDSNQEIQEWTFQTLERIFKKGFEYRKAGIILSGLVYIVFLIMVASQIK